MLEAARKDGQSVTPKGEFVGAEPIVGVRMADLRPVLTRNGAVIESFREDGPWGGFHVRQSNYCLLRVGGASDWHMHRLQNDLITPILGEIHIGLYDDREGSVTQGRSMVLRASPLRMSSVLVPCGVWHALRNAGDQEAGYIVLTDRAYVHADPDDWRLKRDDPVLHGIL